MSEPRRQCNRCGAWKALAEFPKARARVWMCRDCYLEWKRGRYYECRYPLAEGTPDRREVHRLVRAWYAARGEGLPPWVAWSLSLAPAPVEDVDLPCDPQQGCDLADREEQAEQIFG